MAPAGTNTDKFKALELELAIVAQAISIMIRTTAAALIMSRHLQLSSSAIFSSCCRTSDKMKEWMRTLAKLQMATI